MKTTVQASKELVEKVKKKYNLPISLIVDVLLESLLQGKIKIRPTISGWVAEQEDISKDVKKILDIVEEIREKVNSIDMRIPERW